MESTTTTPSAASVNWATVESSRSRRITWSVTSALVTRWPSSAWRRATRADGSATSSTRTGASGATTVVMSRPSATMPRSAEAMICCWRATRLARTARLVATELTAADTTGSRIASVTSLPLMVTPWFVRVQLDGDVRGLDQGRDGGGVVGRHLRVQHQPGGGAIHGPGVEEGQSQLLRDAASRARLARSARTVDRDHQRGGRGPRAYGSGGGGVAVRHLVRLPVTARWAGIEPRQGWTFQPWPVISSASPAAASGSTDSAR